MADKKINVTVSLKTPNKETQGELAKYTSKLSDLDKIKIQSGTAAGTFAAQTIDWVIGELENQALYELEFCFRKNDDYISQRNYQTATRAIANVRNIGNSMLTGASMGSTIGMAFGPMGSAVGAAIGAIVSGSEVALGMARQNINSKREQDFQLQQMENQLSFTRSRAGYSTNAASIGEDL